MTDLEKYEAVNKCKTLKELSQAILQVADDGRVKGRNKSFDSIKMANSCLNYTLENYNMLTREFGIRQQAIMILFHDSIKHL